MNASIEDNIAFFLPKDQAKLDLVVKTCCLDSDISQFPDGLKSEIGERGVNLSGGQKSRLCLARALYADADVYLLDDPLSSSDAKVAKQIFEGLKVALKDKIVIMATHSYTQLSQMDSILFLREGKMDKMKTFSDLESEEPEYFKELSALKVEIEDEKQVVEKEVFPSKIDKLSKSPKKFIVDEEDHEGFVSLETYKDFAKNAGWIVSSIYALILVCAIGVFVFATLWLPTIAAIPQESQTDLNFIIYIVAEVSFILLCGIVS